MYFRVVYLTYVMNVFEIPLSFVKVFLIETKEGLILVDSGTPGNGKKIVTEITRLGKSLDDVKYVVFTHSHGDHIGSAHELKDILPDAKFGIESSGVSYLQEGKIRNPVLHSSLQKFLFGLARPFIVRGVKGTKVDLELKDGKLVEGVEIMKTPGHTSDSISIYLPEIGSVIVGDMLQGTKRGLKYPNIYEDFEELKRSVERIKKLKPKMVYVSHGVSSSEFLV